MMYGDTYKAVGVNTIRSMTKMGRQKQGIILGGVGMSLKLSLSVCEKTVKTE
jgi:hypothetical protein